MTIERLVVVGASLAGVRAVEAARRTGFTGSITLIGAERHLPYDRPPLSKAFLADGADPIHYRTAAELTVDLGVDLRLGTTATALDPDAQQVITADDAVGYDALVIATGSAARHLPDTSELDGVHVLRTLDDAHAIRAALDAKARTVVIGAGFIGSEVASSARKRGLDVTVIEALPTPLVRAVGEQMGAALAGLHTANGTDLRCGVAVASIEGDGHVEQVRLDDGSVISADLVVAGIGASPSTGWLDGSGLTLDTGVVCDETLATGLPGVYAAGDVARWTNPSFGDVMRLEHWTSAAEQGAHAARNAVDPSVAKPYATVPYFWSDWYDTRIQFVGIPEAEEVTVVIGSADERAFVALYRRGDRLVGALAVNRPAETMKFRAQIANAVSWTGGLEFAAARRALLTD